MAQKTVEIINSDLLEMKDTENGKMKTLNGHVVLKQDDVMLYCDNADFMDWDNTVNASGNVKLTQGDSITLYCKQLLYRGNDKSMTATDLVRLQNGKSVLITDKLDYDLKEKKGWYTNGGKLINDSTLLISQIGHYYAGSGDAFFKTKVKLTNPHYTLQADSFRFNVKTKTNYFCGPTNITVDSNNIYCENGFYEINSGESKFIDHAVLLTGAQTVNGDTILFNKITQKGNAIGHVKVIDTVQKMTIQGGKVFFSKNPETMIATNNPLLTLLLDKDSLYINADSLFATMEKKNIDTSVVATASKDSTESRLLRAFKHVRIYNRQFQAVCDSASYLSSDSIFKLYQHPVLWIDSSQLTADTVFIFLKNKAINKLLLLEQAMIATRLQDTLFNQLFGKKITGYFAENKLQTILVNGSAKSIYFSQDDKKAFVGVNKTASGSMKINFVEGKVNTIRFFGQPDASFAGLKRYPVKDLYFKEFKWQENLRPFKKIVTAAQ